MGGVRLRILVPFVVLLALVAPTDIAGDVDGSPATHTWTISAPPVTCSTVTLNANADAWMEQNSPSNNKGTDSTLVVRSKGRPADNFRALVRFNLPAAPIGCVLEAATLRMYSDSPKIGRTIQALQIADAWTEGGVTWSNQPATTGLAVCDAGCGSGPAAPAARVVIGMTVMLGLGVLVVIGQSRLRPRSGAGGGLSAAGEPGSPRPEPRSTRTSRYPRPRTVST